jgi:hypothetical protein
MRQSADQMVEKIKVTEQLQLDGSLFLDGDTNSTDASAISIDPIYGTTWITTAAAETRTLANGIEGQVKFIACLTYVGDAVITPVNLTGTYTTITLNQVGDSWLGVFKNGSWITIALGGSAALA